jgi:S1-C subfamily serine protease
LKLTGIEAGSPAEKAGLQIGDVVSEVNGTSVNINAYNDIETQLSDGPVKIFYERDRKLCETILKQV